MLASIDQVVTWRRDVRLEENARTINASPTVEPQADGSFLVADALEQQLRFYAPDGRLRSTFGRRGSGPGEFQHLAAAVRLRDGGILAADMMGTLTRFDSTGRQVVQTWRSGLGPIYRMRVLDDSAIAIVGRRGGQMETPLVHVWSLPAERVSRSFFPAPQGGPGFAGAYAFTGFADGAVRGDTLAVLFALQDTLRLFLRDGGPVGKLPLPFRSFRPMTDPPPPGMGDDFKEWLGSYSVATAVYWLRDGSFLVQQMDQHGSERSYTLLHLPHDGRGGWQVANSPELLAVAPDGSLVFAKPGSEAPNEWSIGRLKTDG